MFVILLIAADLEFDNGKVPFGRRGQQLQNGQAATLRDGASELPPLQDFGDLGVDLIGQGNRPIRLGSHKRLPGNPFGSQGGRDNRAGIDDVSGQPRRSVL